MNETRNDIIVFWEIVKKLQYGVWHVVWDLRKDRRRLGRNRGGSWALLHQDFAIHSLRNLELSNRFILWVKVMGLNLMITLVVFIYKCLFLCFGCSSDAFYLKILETPSCLVCLAYMLLSLKVQKGCDMMIVGHCCVLCYVWIW